MRTRLAALFGLAAITLLPGWSAAQGTFEGVITYRMSMQGQSITMTQMTKGTRVRTDMEMPGMPGPMYVLMDSEQDIMRTVVPGMGMYMEMNMKEMMDQVPEAAGLRDMAAETPTVERLGTSDQIAGVRCENYRFSQGQQQFEGCIASSLGFFMGGARGGGPGGGAMRGFGMDFSALMSEFKDGMVPLRVRLQENGQWQTVMEATSVERKSLDASLFEVPAGMRKMNMPGGGR